MAGRAFLQLAAAARPPHSGGLKTHQGKCAQSLFAGGREKEKRRRKGKEGSGGTFSRFEHAHVHAPDSGLLFIFHVAY